MLLTRIYKAFPILNDVSDNPYDFDDNDKAGNISYIDSLMHTLGAPAACYLPPSPSLCTTDPIQTKMVLSAMWYLPQIIWRIRNQYQSSHSNRRSRKTYPVTCTWFLMYFIYSKFTWTRHIQDEYKEYLVTCTWFWMYFISSIFTWKQRRVKWRILLLATGFGIFFIFSIFTWSWLILERFPWKLHSWLGLCLVKIWIFLLLVVFSVLFLLILLIQYDSHHLLKWNKIGVAS